MESKGLSIQMYAAISAVSAITYAPFVNMLLAGYEYGTTYWGAPVTGPLLFCIITIAMGILFDYLYEKTNCIWVPALCHGAINAFAGVPMLFLNPAYTDKLLLGPLMIGVISGLPLMLTACILSMREKNTIMKTR